MVIRQLKLEEFTYTYERINGSWVFTSFEIFV